MPLEVHPIAASQSDMEDWAHIHYAAFKDTSVGVVWSHEPSNETFQGLAKQRLQILEDPTAHIFKCVDTEVNNKIISVAHWSIFEKERTMEELEESLKPRPPFEGENRPARLEFLQGIFKSRRDYIGTKPHVMLESLITLPEHHRRGAGSMLLKWGLEQSDNLGVVGYLEGSSAGASLYKRFGYTTIGTVVFDARKYGGSEIDVHEIMIRQPQLEK